MDEKWVYLLSNTCVHMSGTFLNIGLALLQTRIFVIFVEKIGYAVLIIKKSTNRIIEIGKIGSGVRGMGFYPTIISS